MKRKLTLLAAVIIIVATVHGQWSLTGNSIGSTDFLGSLNTQPLIFKVNNLKSGLIDYDITKGNTTFGFQTLLVNTGTKNSAFGLNALKANTKGKSNTAIGYASLTLNTTGSFNTSTGIQAMYSNITGDANVAIGWNSLYLNSDGGFNTATGTQSLYSNTSGYQNAAFGYGTLLNNSTGYANTAIGTAALEMSMSAYNNTAIGYYSQWQYYYGNSITSLGSFSNVNADNFINTTVIGSDAVGTASNQVRIGSSSVGSIGGYVNWTNISDGRVKANIKADVPGLAFIKMLTPVTYNLSLEAADKILQVQEVKDKDGKLISRSPDNAASKKLKEEILYSGFIAQDVEKAASSIDYNFSGVDKPKNDKDLYGLRYAEFVVPLVKAVQELSSTNDSLQQVVNGLQLQIDEIKQQIRSLKTGDVSIVTSGTPFLKQNTPNPFYNNTIISYYVPLNSSHAQIVITDISGRSIKNIAVNNKGFGQVTVSAGTLASGSYVYSLIIDGQRSDSKQMILTK